MLTVTELLVRWQNWIRYCDLELAEELAVALEKVHKPGNYEILPKTRRRVCEAYRQKKELEQKRLAVERQLIQSRLYPYGC